MSRTALWPLLALLVGLAIWSQTPKPTPPATASDAAKQAEDPTPGAAATAILARGDRVWVGRDDGVLVEYGPDGPSPPRVVHGAAIHRITLAGDDLFTVSADGSAAWWGRDGTPKRRERLSGYHLNDGVALPDHTALLVADRGMVARTGVDGWRNPGQHGPAAFAVALSPDGRQAATGGADGRVVIFGVADGKAERVLNVSKAWVTALAWRPEGLYVGDHDGHVTFWSDAAGAEPARIYPDHRGAVVGLAFTPTRVVSASADGAANLSTVEDARGLVEVRAPSGELLDVALTDDEILTAHRDGRVRRWRVTDGAPLGTLPAERKER